MKRLSPSRATPSARATPCQHAASAQRITRRPGLRPTLHPLVVALAGLAWIGEAVAQNAEPVAQNAEPASPAAATPAAPAAAPRDTVLPTVRAKASAEADGKDSVRATTTRIGKGQQALRDVPQSVTVVTERLIDDRNLDTLKDTLKATSGVSFLAPEGGEEDIRLRGFSLQASGDIFIDGMRDPAFYERDSFNWDRLEVLRGSASMLFGRGSTGGAVNQVSKQPGLLQQHELTLSAGSRDYVRATGDFNLVTGESAALRINAMVTDADRGGVRINKRGIAPTYRVGIGQTDEFQVGLYYLQNDNGIHYGLPWLTPGASGGNFLWPTNPGNYYGAASDRNHTGTTQWNAAHVHRFSPTEELRTQVRYADYRRDQRASAVRFAAAAQQPGGRAVTSDTFGDLTRLTRGANNKNMALNTVTAQSDYSGEQTWGGRLHKLQAGVDLARERFENFSFTLPTGVTVTKPVTTVGTPNDGASVDESLRQQALNRSFEAKSLGLYVQDMVSLAPQWKALAGVRLDRMSGNYHAVLAQGQATTGTPPVANPCYTPPDTAYGRADKLLSHRLGLLFQPSETQSYHLSYGTSFNTSGDAYQYDAGTSKTDPEKSRNIELGARLDSEDKRFTTRLALFHSTKYNERNRDADSVNACNYVLSGKRHAVGGEIDLAGRLTPDWEVFGSYTFIPVARVDESSGAAGTEVAGSRPGLTPRHSGSIWSTYRLDAQWRVGAGLTARSAERPQGLAASSPVWAPHYVTADLMAEYVLRDLSLKLNVLNVTDKHYAESIYRGHYVPGQPRTLQATMAYRFY
jgi:catecholate siderophore receptor